MNPFREVELFEHELAEYCGAPYCAAVDSCTNAFFLTMKYYGIKNMEVIFPRRTYLSMPMMALANDNNVIFLDDYEWKYDGMYSIVIPKRKDLLFVDAAKILSKDEFGQIDPYFEGEKRKTIYFKSFHMKKHITSISGKGGAILTDDPDLHEWIIRARWEGRNPYSDYKKQDEDITIVGYNMNMTPEEAVFLRRQLRNMNDRNDVLVEPGDYRNLDEFTVFKDCKVAKIDDKYIDDLFGQSQMHLSLDTEILK